MPVFLPRCTTAISSFALAELKILGLSHGGQGIHAGSFSQLQALPLFLTALGINVVKSFAVGSRMEGVVCQLWDEVTFHGTATGTREAAYREMMFSMLCGVTEQDWFDLLSRGNAVGSGLMSRLNIIGTEAVLKTSAG